MASPKFIGWQGILDKLGLNKASVQNYREATAKFIEHMVTNPKYYDKVTPADVGLVKRECLWHECGRPYYKLYPEISAALANTKFNFTADHLLSPFEIFNVMLPVGQFPTNSLLVNIETYDPPKTDDEYGGQIIKALRCSFFESDGGVQHLNLPFRKDKSIEEELLLSTDIDYPNIGNPNLESMTTLEQRLPLWKLAIATAMFAVNKHELVTSDIKEDLKKRFPGGKSKASQKAAEEQREKAAEKHLGWRIGGETLLPRPAPTNRESGGSHAGYELHHAHYRSGHMKMQPHGPQHSLRKLIFVPPTIVRADLPIKPSAGFKITGKNI